MDSTAIAPPVNDSDPDVDNEPHPAPNGEPAEQDTAEPTTGD